MFCGNGVGSFQARLRSYFPRSFRLNYGNAKGKGRLWRPALVARSILCRSSGEHAHLVALERLGPLSRTDGPVSETTPGVSVPDTTPRDPHRLSLLDERDRLDLDGRVSGNRRLPVPFA